MNNHIVYIGKLDNTVVYVGEGKVGRSNHLNSGTSHVYEANKVHFSGKVIDVEIYEENLTKEQAVTLEKELIQELQPEWNRNLTIKSRMKNNIKRLVNKDVLEFSSKLALIYTCAEVLDTEGQAIIRGRDINDVGGEGSWEVLHKVYKRKNGKKDSMIKSIELINRPIYKITFHKEWIDQLEINIHELNRKAESARKHYIERTSN